MRRCKIVTWIFILSVVNFALGAPVPVRERLEDLAEGWTATSQRRNDPLDDHDRSPTSNAGDSPPPSTPPSLNPPKLERSWEELGEEDIDRHFPPTSESSGSTDSVESSRRDFGQSNLYSDLGLTGAPLRPLRPLGGLIPLPPLPPLRPLPRPGPSEVESSRPAVNPDTLSSTGHQPAPPQRPTGGSPPPPLPDPGPSEDRLPSPPGSSVNPGTLSSTVHQTTPPHSPTSGSPLLDPGPSEGRLPSPEKYLEDVLKGKIKRGISGPGTVNLGAGGPKVNNFPT
jgi:hypothetical protein